MPPSDEPIKFLFLVAGHEYSGHLGFLGMCTRRVAERIRWFEARKDDREVLPALPVRLRFLRFAIGLGEILVYDHLLEAGAPKTVIITDTSWKPLSTITDGGTYDPNKFLSLRKFRKLTAADYEKKTWKGHDLTVLKTASAADTMSIVDIYKSVRGAPAASILELSIFSHAWYLGPILANSLDQREDATLRDPNDVDGRANLDFLSNMGEEPADQDRITSFTAAFDTRGYLQVWGCNRDDPAKSHILRLQHAIPRNQRGAPVDPRLRLDWTNSKGELKKYEFGLLLKTILQKDLAESYAYKAAAGAKIKVVGVLPGPGTEDEKEGDKLMRVPPIHGALLKFYNKYVGIELDKHGYAILSAKTISDIQSLLAFTPTPAP